MNHKVQAHFTDILSSSQVPEFTPLNSKSIVGRPNDGAHNQSFNPHDVPSKAFLISPSPFDTKKKLMILDTEPV